MSKSHLSWLAVVLVVAGVAVISGHPAWGTMTGCAFVLLGGAIAAGAAQVSERYGEPRGERIPNDLVTLSAAAIIAVYATGFQRTKSAADEFQAQAARRRIRPPIASVLELPKAADERSIQPAVQAASVIATAAPSLSRSPGSAPGKDRARRSPLYVQNMEPAVAPGHVQIRNSAPVPSETASASPLAVDVSVASAADAAAPPNIVAPKLHYKDGTYLGWGTCRHGMIQASVVIKQGRIHSATIAQCETAYPCEWIDVLPSAVVLKQDPNNVDVVSGASDSSYAFLDAVAAAILKGQRGE